MVDRKLTLTLLNDTLAPGAKLEYPAVEQGRIIYLVEGSARLSIGNNTVDLQANEARLAPGPLSVEAGPHGAKLLRWELTTLRWSPYGTAWLQRLHTSPVRSAHCTARR